MYCIFHEAHSATFMIHPQGFKTILNCSSCQDIFRPLPFQHLGRATAEEGAAASPASETALTEPRLPSRPPACSLFLPFNPSVMSHAE